MRRIAFISWLALCAVALLGTSFVPAQAAILQEGLAAHLETLDDDDLVSVILIMEHQAPVADLNEMLKQERASLAQRHTEIVTALQEASLTQSDLLADLDARKVAGDVTGYTSFWISNLVVAQVTKAYLYELTARSDIAFIERNFGAELIEPIVDPQVGVDQGRGIGVTSGLRAINADRVWYELGITGDGVLVANCDTGVDGNHPALADRWRGAHGHPASECWLTLIGGNPNFPTDTNNHGTHVMGTITGLGAATEDTIGVAWDALWIATDPINQGVSYEFNNDIIVAYQWFADPDGDPQTHDDVPDVVQNSWRINEGFGLDYEDCDSRWWEAIDNCEAAGVVTTWSAGNEGPGSYSIGSPADRATTLTNAFSVGAIDGRGSYPYPIASFSSRGPTGCDVPEDRKIKPEISAPGVYVYSSIPGGGYTDGYSGTSMAGPHVAGVVALMRQANPDADVDLIKEVIMQTAVDHGTAGEDNDYGWGVIDAYEAVLAVMTGFGTLEGMVTNASDAGAPLGGITIEVVEADRTTESAEDGSYGMSVQPDTYTVTASHPSFDTETAHGIVIEADETTVVNFAMTDIAGPVFADVTELRSTDDTVGPYVVEATVTDFSSLDEISLFYRVNGSGWTEMVMTPGAGDLFTAEIPGQDYVSHVEYYLAANDVAGNETMAPLNAPTDVYDFYVAERSELLAEDVEGGAGDWTHANVEPGFSDQWHVSTARNYTPGGAYSWKCGDTGSGDYGNLLDAGLVTVPFTLGIDSELTYWQWIDAETSGAYPDYCYDGGLVEISIDGGPFTQLFPEEGYTYLIREGSTPGPFPVETQVFSGSYDWHPVTFDLRDFEGEAQIRFRFGSDGAATAEGWYIDDVLVDGFQLDYSAIDSQPAFADRLLLNAADPNPFAGSTTLRYRLPGEADVLLQIFDMNGRLVRTLSSGHFAPGQYEVEWDGHDSASQPVPTGVYFSRLKAGNDETARKIVVTR